MASLDDLVGRIAAQENLKEGVELLVVELAQRIRATSNDQNIQKLSRELTAAKSDLVRALAGKAAVLS